MAKRPDPSRLRSAMADDPFLAVINPAAGGGRCGKRFPAALERLKEGGVKVDTVEVAVVVV